MVRWALFILGFILLYGSTVFAQAPGHIKDTADRDSIRNAPYLYVLPALGEKVQKMGNELPLPFGIMANYVHQVTKLNLTDLRVSLGGLPYADIDFVEFGTIENRANVANFRADAWVLPFLNVYGIYAFAQGESTIPITFPIDFTVIANPVVNTYGGGIVVAYGRGDYFGAANINLSWSDVSSLKRLVYGRVISLRIGRSIKLKQRNHSLNFSVGLQNQFVDRFSEGTLPVSDIFGEIDPQKLQELKDQIGSAANNWYDELSLPQRLVVDRLVEGVVDWQEGRNTGDLAINYQFNKEALNPWSIQLGVQYNYGKRWWYRAEYGVGGGRLQLLLSVNYRFGIYKTEYR